ncbi:MAG: TonB-dependent receptor [Chitinophagaceae bacterium]
MQSFTKRICCFALIIFISTTSFAGVIKGRVTDARTGEPLVGATVEIVQNKVKKYAIVNLDGSYIIKNLPAGDYELSIKSVGYGVIKNHAVVVKSENDAIVFDTALQSEASVLNEVTVTTGSKESDHAARSLEKSSPVLVNILSQKTIELLPDLTVANALQRVSGVSIQRSSSGEGRYAIIRGMDERYNNTLVNGVKIPSPDAKYRYVPMDMFPSDMLERLEVIKSLTPAMEGDAVGGTMNLVMKSAPQHFLFNANIATGFSGLFSSSRPFAAYNHGVVNSQSPAEIHGNDYATTQNDFSKGNLNFTSHDLPFNTVAGITTGGRLAHQKLGIILSASYQNMYRGSNSDFLVPNAQPQVVGDLNNQSVISDLYIRHYSTQTKRIGLHNKIDYHFNKNNTISLYNMYVHMNEFQSRSTYDSVYLNKLSDNLYRSRTQKQSIYNSTLQGDHVLGNMVSINWTGSYARATSKVPDMAEYDYQSAATPGTYIVQKMSRIWQRNTDQDIAGYLNVTFKPVIGKRTMEFIAGAMYRHKSRDNYYNDYSLSPVLTGGQPQYWKDYNSASYNFSPASNATGAITTTNPNTYTSTEDVSAAYGQFKVMAGKHLEILGGIRFEHTKQDYTTIMPESYAGRYGTVTYTDPLPSLHLKYGLDEKQNIRLSYFRSIVRPDFYEIIPTQINGELFDIKGNDSLKHSTADNFDLRYEFFGRGADQFLAGVFYKNIYDPIEFAIVRNGGPSAQFFMPENFGTAHNYGFEAVFTKYIGKFGLSANYTYTHSEITTTKQYFYRDPTLGITSKLVDQKRPLQGQADHIANVSALYKNPKIGLDLQVAFVYTGKRIAQVSPYYMLDYWQLGQGVLDFSFEKRFGHHFYFYGKINNITNTPSKVVFYQAPATGNKFPDQTYSDRTVVGKDIYQINILGGIRYKF